MHAEDGIYFMTERIPICTYNVYIREIIAHVNASKSSIKANNSLQIRRGKKKEKTNICLQLLWNTSKAKIYEGICEEHGFIL